MARSTRRSRARCSHTCRQFERSDPVNDLGSKFGFAFRHNASGSFGLAGGAQGGSGFEAIVGLINLFEPTAESYDFAAEKLDGVELLGCVTAPLLLNAFHLLDDSVKEIETGGKTESSSTMK